MFSEGTRAGCSRFIFELPRVKGWYCACCDYCFTEFRQSEFASELWHNATMNTNRVPHLSPDLLEAFDTLDDLRRQGLHAAAYVYALELLEDQPSWVSLHAHVIRATLELEGVEAARRAWLSAASMLLRGDACELPEFMVGLYGELTALPSPRGALKAEEIVEVSPSGGNLVSVQFADGRVLRLSAVLLERVYGVSYPRGSRLLS
jgi:hypothetical protein